MTHIADCDAGYRNRCLCFIPCSPLQNPQFTVKNGSRAPETYEYTPTFHKYRFNSQCICVDTGTLDLIDITESCTCRVTISNPDVTVGTCILGKIQDPLPDSSRYNCYPTEDITTGSPSTSLCMNYVGTIISLLFLACVIM